MTTGRRVMNTDVLCMADLSLQIVTSDQGRLIFTLRSSADLDDLKHIHLDIISR